MPRLRLPTAASPATASCYCFLLLLLLLPLPPPEPPPHKVQLYILDALHRSIRASELLQILIVFSQGTCRSIGTFGRAIDGSRIIHVLPINAFPDARWTWALACPDARTIKSKGPYRAIP